jgi:hypothetical protein
MPIILKTEVICLCEKDNEQLKRGKKGKNNAPY